METTLYTDGLIRPAYDRKLQQVDSHVTDVKVALQHVKERGLVFQAGGAYGLWPRHLAQYFDLVVTCEPDRLNFTCLCANTASVANVVALQAAIGKDRGWCTIQRDDFEADNAGAGYVADGSSTPVLTIDSLRLPRLDLLCLDIEGYELFALQGAEGAIDRFRPVIMLEVKPLPQMTGYGVTALDAIGWLLAHRYQRVADVHRDVVMVPR